MALTKIQISQGVQADLTSYAAEGSWRDSDKIRFRDGRVEPIGGYLTLDQASAVIGIGRDGHIWAENDGTKVIAFGTNRRLYLLRGGVVYNITPVRTSGTLGSGPIATTSGSAVVTITHSSHGLIKDAAATLGGAAAVGGITVDGEYFVTSVVDSNTYTITHSGNASSTTTGGGASVTFSYEINPGPASATPGYGWGAGTWGLGTWGTPRTSSNITLALRSWSLDNWGEDLIASPRGGTIYLWDSSGGASAVAAIISAAPDTVTAVIISPEDRHMIALGDTGDPMQISWCAQGDYTNWTSGVGSTADSRQLLDGSMLHGGLRTKGEILIWSDTALYSMRYTGTGDYVFDIDRIGDKCAIMGINTMVEHNGISYWMGKESFYLYNGRVLDMPSSVLRTVFDDINKTQSDKCFAVLNEQWGEVWYFYPSAGGTGEIDKYCKVNIRNGAWDIGTFDRTWWVDAGPWDYPVAADASNVMYEHERGTNADGSMLGDYIESGEFDLGDGEEFVFCLKALPDVKLSGSNSVDLTISHREYINEDEPYLTSGPHTVTTATRRIDDARFRNRHAKIRWAGSSPESSWRLGDTRFDIQPDGEQ